MSESGGLNLYRSSILPHPDYVDSAYMVATVEKLRKLQLIQSVSCRVILKAENRNNVKEMHTTLVLLDLETRRNMHFSFTCHKVVVSTGKSSPSKFFKPLKTGARRNTRPSNGKNMKVPNMTASKGRFSFAYRGPNHWKCLTNALKDIEKFCSSSKDTLKN